MEDFGHNPEKFPYNAFEIKIFGRDFELDDFQKKSSLFFESSGIWRKNERGLGRPTSNGLTINMGDGEKISSSEQQRIYIEFLSKKEIPEILKSAKVVYRAEYINIGIQRIIVNPYNTLVSSSISISNELCQLCSYIGATLVVYVTPR